MRVTIFSIPNFKNTTDQFLIFLSYEKLGLKHTILAKTPSRTTQITYKSALHFLAFKWLTSVPKYYLHNEQIVQMLPNMSKTVKVFNNLQSTPKLELKKNEKKIKQVLCTVNKQKKSKIPHL